MVMIMLLLSLNGVIINKSNKMMMTMPMLMMMLMSPLDRGRVPEIVGRLPRLASRLRRCIATINRWTDYCNNREIIIVIIGCLKKTSQNNRSRWFKKIITPMVM